MHLSDGAGTSRASCAFRSVDDIDREVAELRARGVTFERYDLSGTSMDGDIATGGGTKAAWFKDPDENILGSSNNPPADRSRGLCVVPARNRLGPR